MEVRGSLPTEVPAGNFSKTREVYLLGLLVLNRHPSFKFSFIERYLDQCPFLYGHGFPIDGFDEVVCSLMCRHGKSILSAMPAPRSARSWTWEWMS
jgi:hypothetical protein